MKRKLPWPYLQPYANGHKIVGQQLPTLLDVTGCAHLHTCCMLLCVCKVWNNSQHSGFCSMIAKVYPNIVWSVCPLLSTLLGLYRHPRYSYSCGLYPSHDALQATTLLGVVTSICTPLPTHAQQLPIMLGVVTSFRTYLKKTWFQPLSHVQSCSFLRI